MKKPKPSRGKANPQTPRPVQQKKSTSGRNWLLLILVFLVAGGGTWAVLEYVVWAKLPAQLVGKWVVEGGEQDGATFDFYRDGSMVGRINVNGKEGVIKAQVSMEGDKLHMTTKNPYSNRDETRTQIIKIMTEQELVLEDDRGQVVRMKRAD